MGGVGEEGWGVVHHREFAVVESQPILSGTQNAYCQKHKMSCYRLTSLRLPDSLKSIDNGAFVVCSALTTLTLPESLKSIGDVAFTHCTGLTSLTLPNSVTSVGKQVFADCTPGSLGRPTPWVRRGCNSLCREDRACALSFIE